MKQIYVSSNEKDGGIYRFDWEESGALIFKEKKELSFPLYALEKDGELWAVCNDCVENRSGLIRIPLGEDGSMGEADLPLDTLGEEGCHLSFWEDRIWVANYTDGSVFSSCGERKVHEGKGADPLRQEGPHPHFAGPTPDGRYLAVVDLGLDRIFVYHRDFSLHSSVSLPAGSGPRHLAFSPDGKYAFVACELNSRLEMFSYRDGVFTPLDSAPSIPPSFGEENYPAAVRVRENRVYLSNRGHDSIASWKFGSEGLTDFCLASCGGRWPRDMQWAGKYLVVANEKSHSVTVMRLRENGNLELMPQAYSVPSALCVTVTEEPQE